MKFIFCSFIILCVFTSCSETKELVFVEVPALKASEIYSPNEVKKYLNQYENQHHAIATSYKEKAEVAIKAKDLKKAIYFLKRSITLEPTLDTYEKLIRVLSDVQNYAEATDAYKVLVGEAYYEINGAQIHDYIFSLPSENTISDFVILSVLANNKIDYNTLCYLDDSMDKQQIRANLIADPRFKYDSSNIEHKNIIIQLWTVNEIEIYKSSLSNLNALFNSVSDTSSVFEVNQKNVNQFNYENFNGMNYSEFDETIVLKDMVVYYLKEKMDHPNSWLRYNINHAFHPQATLKAIVYAVDTSATACPIEMREIYHRLIIYDSDGKMVSNRVVARQSGEILQTVVFNKDSFEITESKRIWTKPYNNRDFDNEISKIELISKKSYNISSSGKIVEVAPTIIE
jgi:tetratricopeptide (TPR) repeat protein